MNLWIAIYLVFVCLFIHLSIYQSIYVFNDWFLCVCVRAHVRAHVRACVLYALLDIQSSEEGIRVSEICVTDVYELQCTCFKQNPFAIYLVQEWIILIKTGQMELRKYFFLWWIIIFNVYLASALEMFTIYCHTPKHTRTVLMYYSILRIIIKYIYIPLKR